MASNALSAVSSDTNQVSKPGTLSLKDVTQSIENDLKECIGSLSTQLSHNNVSPEAAITQLYRLSQMMNLLSSDQREALQGIFEALQAQLNIFLSKNTSASLNIEASSAAQSIEKAAPKISSAHQYLAYRDMIIDAAPKNIGIKKSNVVAETAGIKVVNPVQNTPKIGPPFNTTQNQKGASAFSIFGKIRPLLRFVQPLLNLDSPQFTKANPKIENAGSQFKALLYPKQAINPKEAPAIVSAFQINPCESNTKAILSAFQPQSTLTKSTQEQEPTLFTNTNPKKNQNSIHLNEFIIPYVNATV